MARATRLSLLPLPARTASEVMSARLARPPAGPPAAVRKEGMRTAPIRRRSHASRRPRTKGGRIVAGIRVGRAGSSTLVLRRTDVPSHVPSCLQERQRSGYTQRRTRLTPVLSIDTLFRGERAQSSARLHDKGAAVGWTKQCGCPSPPIATVAAHLYGLPFTTRLPTDGLASS